MGGIVHPELEVLIRILSQYTGRTLRALLGASMLTAPAAAQQSDPPNRWDGAAELSYTDQSGNRSLRLLTAGLKVSHRQTDAFELEGLLSTRYGSSEDEVVARNHYGSLTFDLHPQDTWSPFLFADAERDEFKRLDLRFSGGTGAKYTLYRQPGGQGKASLSLALLYSHQNFDNPPGEVPLDTRTTARWSLRARGSQDVRDGVEFYHTTFYQPVWDEVADYLLRSETGAKVLLMERLALSVEYRFDRTARPPQGVEPDDRLLKTGLIINF